MHLSWLTYSVCASFSQSEDHCGRRSKFIEILSLRTPFFASANVKSAVILIIYIRRFLQISLQVTSSILSPLHTHSVNWGSIALLMKNLEPTSFKINALTKGGRPYEGAILIGDSA